MILPYRAIPLSGQGVGAKHQHAAEHGFHQAHRGGQAVIHFADTLRIHPGIDDFTAGTHFIGQEYIHLVEARVQHLADVEDQQDNEDLADAGQGDVPDLAETAAAIHRGGLVQRGIDAHDGGQIDDGAPAQSLPQVGAYQHGLEVFVAGHKGNGGAAHLFNEGIDNAVALRQHSHADTVHNNPAEEVGQVTDGLHDAGKEAIAALRYRQGEDQRGKQTHSQLPQRQRDGVFNHVAVGRAGEKLLKILVPGRYPRAAQDTLFDAELFEGDDQAVHGGVLVHQEINDAGQQHQVQRPPARHGAAKTHAKRLLVGGIEGCGAHASSLAGCGRKRRGILLQRVLRIGVKILRDRIQKLLYYVRT